MNRNKIKKNLASAVMILLLSILAYWAIEGALEQWPRSETFGQKLETVTQFFFGILSILTMMTQFWLKRTAGFIRYLWVVSLAGTAGLSSLVWGPPMPLISLAFASVASLFAWGMIAAMRFVEKKE